MCLFCVIGWCKRHFFICIWNCNLRRVCKKQISLWFNCFQMDLKITIKWVAISSEILYRFDRLILLTCHKYRKRDDQLNFHMFVLVCYSFFTNTNNPLPTPHSHFFHLFFFFFNFFSFLLFCTFYVHSYRKQRHTTHTFDSFSAMPL